MKKKLIPFIAIVLGFSTLHAQQIGFKCSNNVTSFPVTGFPKVFYTQFHPGMEFNYKQQLKNYTNSKFVFEAGLGGFYHRFFQTAVRLTGSVYYDHNVGKRFGLFAGLGGGYMHSFYQYSIFQLNEEGQYLKQPVLRGRAQFTVQLGLGVHYNLCQKAKHAMRLVFEYRPFVHGSFAKAYVPVVPYNSIHVGLLINIKSQEPGNNKTKDESK